MRLYDSPGYGSHLPLIHLMMYKLTPQLVVELGPGLFSTKAFLSYPIERFITIENDEEWVEYIKKRYPNIQVLIHRLPSYISPYTSLTEIKTNITQHFITNYYRKLYYYFRREKYIPKLLFVDNFACCRKIAITTLGHLFDIIIWHDSQVKQYYCYDFVDKFCSKYDYYTLKVSLIHTDCLLKKTHNILFDDLKFLIDTYILQYCQLYKISPNACSFVKNL